MEKEYKLIATKISPETYELIEAICAKKKITKYDLLQIVCDMLVRYMSDRHNLTPNMEAAIMLFEHADEWSHAFNLCDYTAEKEVTEATYFFGDPDKKGVRAVHVKAPYFGDWSQEMNVGKIFERTLCLMMPTRYKRMRQLAQECGCESQIELIDMLINDRCSHNSLQEIREGFEDAARSDYGTKPTDTPYKRKMHRSVDSVNEQLARQQVIQFDEEDEHTAEMEANDSWERASDARSNNGTALDELGNVRPHGCEEL